MSETQLTTDVAIQYLESIIYEDFAPYTQKCLLKVIEVAREAESVVHGEWILDEYGNPHCSKCEHVQDAQTNYCSECGAEMSCMSKTLTPADIRKLQPELEAYRVQHIAEVTKMLKGIEELDKRKGDQK